MKKLLFKDKIENRLGPIWKNLLFCFRYNAEDPEESTRDDLFVRKDIPLKMTQQEKEALDRKENRIWPVKENKQFLDKAFDVLNKRYYDSLKKDENKHSEL